MKLELFFRVERTRGKLWDAKNVALKCENAIITGSERQQNVKGAGGDAKEAAYQVAEDF